MHRVLMLVSALALTPAAAAQTRTLVPSQDNVVYEPPSGTGQSNALHPGVFAGNTSLGEARRALLQFDIAGNIPAGSTITDVQLSLTVTRHPLGVVDGTPFSLHRLTSAWGEGTSLSGGDGGTGAPATPGDATWDNAFEPSTPWESPGGDFSSTPSATQMVELTGSTATWSDPGLVGDVQAWLDDTSANHGWALLGDEGPIRTARRFGSREHPTPSSRPLLFVEYFLPIPSSFCDDTDGSLASCPCAAGAPDSGCDIQQGTGGVQLKLRAQQTSPQNRVTFNGKGFPVATTPTALVIRATTVEPSPVIFGDGLRCVGTPIVRLAATFASAGTSNHTFGHGVAAGSGSFYYQLWFRNTPIMYCDPTAAFNLSSGRSLVW